MKFDDVLEAVAGDLSYGWAVNPSGELVFRGKTSVPGNATYQSPSVSREVQLASQIDDVY
jgi:hypothetical protein